MIWNQIIKIFANNVTKKLFNLDGGEKKKHIRQSFDTQQKLLLSTQLYTTLRKKERDERERESTKVPNRVIEAGELIQ